ncbi:cytochrome c [Shimia sp.]|uniref:c-type cytochrome n=1 Tax=Shimia sp. TaxID=1954381 RepID=UPI00329A741D
MNWKIPMGAGITLLVGAAAWFQLNSPEPQIVGDNAALVAVTIPDHLGEKEQFGSNAFATKCAACHGANASGLDGAGPPLIHKIYEPSHHDDASFYRAVDIGVRAHHWPFGDMAPVSGLTRSDVAAIIAYIRAVQRANGIS